MADDGADDEAVVDTDGGSELGGNGGVSATATPLATYFEMTEMAVQQLAVVVGVALLAGGLYMAMIGVDHIMQSAEEIWTKHFTKKKVKDPEAPADLVGSFKRYK